MSIFRKLFGARAPTPQMILEGEGLSPIVDPTAEQVRSAVLGLTIEGASFLSLTDETGSYIQAAGSRPWCVLERRISSPLRHERAFQATPNPKYNDGAKLRTGAGDIELKHDEWFLLKDAAEMFTAFLHRQALPARVEWRSLNEVLGI